MARAGRSIAGCACLATCLVACAGPAACARFERFALTSPAFAAGGPIPARFTCRGAGPSPPLAWTAPPAGTLSLAVEAVDPDASVRGGFTHWLGWGIPPREQMLPVGGRAPVSGANDAGGRGYTGPCPPSGVHHYHFTLYALDLRRLPLRAGAGRSEFERALRGHVLARATLVGTFAAG